MNFRFITPSSYFLFKTFFVKTFLRNVSILWFNCEISSHDLNLAFKPNSNWTHSLFFLVDPCPTLQQFSCSKLVKIFSFILISLCSYNGVHLLPFLLTSINKEHINSCFYLQLLQWSSGCTPFCIQSLQMEI